MTSTNTTRSPMLCDVHFIPPWRNGCMVTFEDSGQSSRNHNVAAHCLKSGLKASLHLFWMCGLLITGLLLAFSCAQTSFISSADAIPPQSIISRGQGLAQVNEPLPWISGWDLDGRAQNVQKLLQLKPAEVRAVYVMLCHTQSGTCVENLRFLQSVRGVLESEWIDTILVFTEDISSSELSTWLELRGIYPSPRFQVLIDRFHRSALRLGAYQDASDFGTLMRSNVRDVNSSRRQDQSPQDVKDKRLHVPLGVLVSPQGKVMTIIVQGGADLVDRISESLRYLSVE